MAYSGLSLVIAALVLLSAALIGWLVARRAELAAREPRPAE